MLFTSDWARETHCLNMEMEFKVLHLIMFGVAFHSELNLEILKKCGSNIVSFCKMGRMLTNIPKLPLPAWKLSETVNLLVVQIIMHCMRMVILCCGSNHYIMWQLLQTRSFWSLISTPFPSFFFSMKMALYLSLSETSICAPIQCQKQSHYKKTAFFFLSSLNWEVLNICQKVWKSEIW